MYGPLDAQKFEKTSNGIKYKHEIKLKGEKEGEFVNSIRKCYLKKTSLQPQIISCTPADGASRHDPLTEL